MQDALKPAQARRKYPSGIETVLDYLDDVDKDDKDIWYIKPVNAIDFAKKYINLDKFSKAQLAVLNKIFCKKMKNRFFNIEQAILRIGQGGGKNYLVTFIVVYAIYLWCCLKDPHKIFGLQYHEPFDILNFSQINAQQARNVFFKTLANVMRNVKDPESGENWFTKFMGFRVADYGKKDIKEKEMTIPNRIRERGGIRIYCLDSTAKSVEGYTIWMFIMDELSRADTPIKYATAKKQYNTALTNANTRFKLYYYLGLAFAYPEQETNDLLVELYDKHCEYAKENSCGIKDDVLTAWYYTYVFNPKKTEKEYLRKHKLDPIDADRRWKAMVPPNKFGFFMPYIGKIQECANPKLVNPVKYKMTLTERLVNVRGETKIRQFTAIEILNVLSDGRRRYWGMDASETGDSFIIAGGYPDVLEHEVVSLELEHYTKEGEKVTETIAVNCKPVIDIIIKYVPSRKYPVDYVNVENVLTRLLGDEFRESKGIQSDKYQSESLKQKMLDIGIRGAEARFPSNPVQVRMGKILRHLVWNNAVEYLDDPLLIREMTKLLFINNSKIDHPAGESKDIYDGVVNCVCQIIEAGINMTALDIDGIQTEDVQDDTRRLEMYEKGVKEFQKKHGRIYHDAREFCMFMRTIGYKFDEYDVEICETEREYRDEMTRESTGMPDVNEIGGLDIGI